jgi:virulence-associated protein VagC
MKATARVFRNGGSQAIRLPKRFRFPGKTVTLQSTRGGVLIKTTPDRERRLLEAARAYQALLSDHPAEQAEMDAWESASLAD